MKPEPDRLELKDFIRHVDPSQLWFQLDEIVNQRTYLKHGIELGPGHLVVDVGANVGVAAAFFLSDCGVEEVHSFEPLPPIYKMLVENVDRFPGSRTYPFGLSDSEGSSDFIYYEGAAAMSSRYADPGRDEQSVRSVLLDMGLSEAEADARLEGDFRPQTIRCELRTLSSVIDERSIRRIDLLKVDVERAELDVLRGVEERHWPMIRQVVAEVHDEGGRLDEIRMMLASKGLETVVAQEESMKSTAIFVVYARRS